jgi:REP element-mobilizing transposase RayT
MTYNPDIHHRRSIRLRDYDYSSVGAYFVTMCVQNHECLFGEIVDGGMVLNDAGRMIQATWEALPESHQVVQLDEFQVMPNHFHGIVILNDCRGESCIRPVCIRPTCIRPVSVGNADGHIEDENQGEHKVRPYVHPNGTDENSLGRVIQALKSLTTHTYVTGVKESNWPPFPGKLWQRNYYERVIRNDDELNRAREYIMNNPLKWDLDTENPVQIL